MISKLSTESKKFLQRNNLPYKRYFIKNKSIKHRLTIITGQRGIGKTTTIAQYMKENSDKKSLYVSMDNFLIGELSMYEIAELFEQVGGELLCFDEIHKYSNWSQELKSIYDNFPKLQIIASGSSTLEINKGSHDLSRRAHVLKMHGMSLREYLELTLDTEFSILTIKDILENHEKIAFNISEQFEKLNQRILPIFKRYLKVGYYPYSLDINDDDIFIDILKQNIDISISYDLLSVYPSLDGNSMKKLNLLLKIIMQSVPFVPVIERLKSSLEIGDGRTIKEYFIKLEDAGIIKLLMSSSSKGLQQLEKPEKIYLDNTNLLNIANSNIGTERETFFLNATAQIHNVTYPKKGDFLIDNNFLFEVGGRNKGFNQIKDIHNSFIACDDLEIGYGNKIPLWLFGFLY
ncbi:ATP-binding protein [Candidatus Sulfurimonas baltica]|uniref:ATP-binding protein n=1 Tax=Candidatus Sulfurimonas baltica TaxID=2740404 RepID=A0A7S7LUY6_9BACT|nr:AAA family ATPase [Candidatus Sulfurimonas baltica]QOY51815.1 ATP-binding protein [Candidatus Sulfurimonas baltica]